MKRPWIHSCGINTFSKQGESVREPGKKALHTGFKHKRSVSKGQSHPHNKFQEDQMDVKTEESTRRSLVILWQAIQVAANGGHWF